MAVWINPDTGERVEMTPADTPGNLYKRHNCKTKPDMKVPENHGNGQLEKLKKGNLEDWLC